MKVQVFTHVLSEKMVRRFFVSHYQNECYKKIQAEISMIISNKYFDKTISELKLQELHDYVKLRIDSILFWPTHNGEIDRITLRDHLLDFCDVTYSYRVAKLPGGLSYRMFRHSEPLGKK